MEATKQISIMPNSKSLVDQMEALQLDSHPNEEFFGTTQTMQNFKRIKEYLNFINIKKYCPIKKLLVLLKSNTEMNPCVLKKSLIQNVMTSVQITEKFDFYVETLLRYIVSMLYEGSNDDGLQILKYFDNLKETMFYFAKNPLFANFETTITINHFVRHLIVMIREELSKQEIWKKVGNNFITTVSLSLSQTYLLQIMRYMIICIGTQEEHCQAVLEGLEMEFNKFLHISEKDVFDNSWLPLEYYLNILKELITRGVLRKRKQENIAAIAKIQHLLLTFSKSDLGSFGFENQIEDILSWFQLSG